MIAEAEKNDITLKDCEQQNSNVDNIVTKYVGSADSNLRTIAFEALTNYFSKQQSK